MMRLFLIIIVICFSRELCVVYGANILGVFPSPGYSQFILGEKLMQTLADRGHNVTVISPYSPKKESKNYFTIKTSEMLTTDLGLTLFDLEAGNLFENILSTYRLGYIIAEVTLRNEQVQQLLRSNKTFDLVIVEQFFIESLMGFSSHFNAPLVLFSSVGSCEWSNHLVGNPTLASISPLSWTPYSRQMGFFQRLTNLAALLYNASYRNLVSYPHHEALMKKYFPGSHRMNFYDIIYNSSLLLLNSHVTTSENVPLGHGIVEIGGFHVDENTQELDAQVKKYLDSADKGAILFSLGSNLRSSDLSKESIATLLRVFGRLEQKVLWKFEEELPNKPENVLISKWLKQADILAHPNVRLFITHGGLLSTTEAIFYGVPMVGIPIFGDQKMNMARVKVNNMGEIVPFSQLGQEDVLYDAINKTLNDPRYQYTARQFSNSLRDNVVRPLDLAMFWIEYVLRNQGRRFISPALQLYWYQLYLVDIVGFLCVVVMLLYFGTRKLVLLILSLGKGHAKVSKEFQSLKRQPNVDKRKSATKSKKL